MAGSETLPFRWCKALCGMLPLSVVGVQLEEFIAEGEVDLLQRSEVELADLALVAAGEPRVEHGRLGAELAGLEHRLEVADAERGALHRLQEIGDIAGREGRL